jgi:predicted ArsR family transcriptional regulator
MPASRSDSPEWARVLNDLTGDPVDARATVASQRHWHSKEIAFGLRFDLSPRRQPGIFRRSARTHASPGSLFFFLCENPTMSAPTTERMDALAIPLERDLFLRTLIRELSGTLQDVVGLDEASGFISVVGQRIGEEINESYKSALEVSKLSREQVAAVLVDLKRRIRGDFYIIEEDDEKIVLGNRACPFAEKVLGRPAMCMMTSNVFGVIAAENNGYAKVVLAETIAQGDAGCRVVVHLKPTAEAEQATGREYFKG